MTARVVYLFYSFDVVYIFIIIIFIIIWFLSCFNVSFFLYVYALLCFGGNCHPLTEHPNLFLISR